MTKLRNVLQLEPVRIDTNAGFMNSVPKEINGKLIELQMMGYKIETVDGPILDGRFCHYNIQYIIPELDLGGDEEVKTDGKGPKR